MTSEGDSAKEYMGFASSSSGENPSGCKQTDKPIVNALSPAPACEWEDDPISRIKGGGTTNRFLHNRDMFPPIGQLPVELLQQIFIESISPKRPVSLAAPPLLLCHVCSAWREAAFGTSRLWDTLSLLVPLHLSELDHHQAIEMSNFWFNKAENRPLSLSLEFANIACNSSDVLDDIAIPHSKRLTKLVLLNIAPEDRVSFLTLGDGHVEALERLELSFYFSCRFRNTPITVFRSAPRLRKVILRDIDDSSWLRIDGRILLPWAQLTHLKITTILTYQTWRRLISRCPLLERCAFAIVFDHMDPVDISLPAVTFPNLVDMTITAIFHAIQPFRIRDLSFPTLYELGIVNAFVNASWIQASHDTLRIQSLQRLTLVQCEISIDDMATLFRATSSLTELNLVLHMRDIVVHRLWEMLTFTYTHDRGSSTNFLPILEVLDISLIAGGKSIMPMECSRMIQSRWSLLEHANMEENVCLQRVSLHLSAVEQDEREALVASLELCGLEGLDISMDTEVSSSDRSEQW